MTYALSAAGTLAIIALAYFGMLKGWRHRQQRQADLATLPAVPTALAEAPEGVEGVYIATTTAGDWMDRIAVHELGVRSVADLAVTEAGLLFRRRGAADVFIPADQVTGVRTDRGIAGKVTAESSGLVVVTWLHDGRELDTGFRPRRKADTATLTSSISTLIGADR
ncbi:PH-like domain-containing protein [Kribbella deserti]|uniref:PH domain-containing protein n=1 Tax=Kribbella deserti TaxID=1926257 RepID=A0ABV6QH23_9ACTN